MAHKDLSAFVNGYLGCPLLSAVSLYQMCLAVCHQTVSCSQAVLLLSAHPVRRVATFSKAVGHSNRKSVKLIGV